MSDTSGRRYDDKEIAAIFRAAADGPSPSPGDVPRDEGLTLPELQSIGQEVGISPEAVARAASALDVHRGAESRTILGLPIGVARTVDLNRRLSDDEWERLVVRLREVFDARGAMRSEGSLRQWTNGNLQVLLEPTDTGHRLGFRTIHGAAIASIRAGFMALGMSGIVAVAAAAGTHFTRGLPGVAFLFLAGAGMIANGALRLPRWASLRRRQMEDLAEQVALPASPRDSAPGLPPGSVA
jgi:hypothetical protein